MYVGDEFDSAKKQGVLSKDLPYYDNRLITDYLVPIELLLSIPELNWPIIPLLSSRMSEIDRSINGVCCACEC